MSPARWGGDRPAPGQPPGSSPGSPEAPRQLPPGPEWPARCWGRRWRCSPAPGTSPLPRARRRTLPRGEGVHWIPRGQPGSGGAGHPGVALTEGRVGHSGAVQLVGAVGAVVPAVTHGLQRPALAVPAGKLRGAAGFWEGRAQGMAGSQPAPRRAVSSRFLSSLALKPPKDGGGTNPSPGSLCPRLATYSLWHCGLGRWQRTRHLQLPRPPRRGRS